MSTRAARRSPRVKVVKEELPDIEETNETEEMMVVEEDQDEVEEEVNNDEAADDEVADNSDADGDYVPPTEKRTLRPQRKVAKEEIEDLETEDMPIDIYEFPNEEEVVGEKTVPGHLCKGCFRIFTSQGGLKRHLRACPNIADKLPLDKLDLLEQSTEMIDDTTAAEEFEREGMCHCCGEDIETAHVGGEFPCSDCEKSFKLRSSYERHRRVVHSEGTTFDCPECNARCPDKGTLARHMYTHTGLKPYECPVCHTEFSRRYHLVRHNYQTGCNGKQRPTFPCQVCGRVFNRKDNLREHLRAHAGETKRKKKYKCDQCDKEFYGITLLKIHQRLHTEGTGEAEQTIKIEPGKRGRPHSMKALAMQGEKPYECDLCHNRFPSSGAMKKHRRKHTGERPYECKECYAKFAAKETLNRHMKTHSGVKPHACEHCGKAFIQASQLKAHMFHHTGENGHTCDICNKTFNRKARLELHIKYIHEGADPFQCDICRRTFIRKEDLNRHSLLHTGVKPHKCPICTKGFTMKSSLKIHLLTHTKEPPRACEVCGRAFIRQDCLLRHLRQKHRDHLDEVVAQTDKKKLEAQLLAAAACELTSVLEDENEAEGSEEGTRGSPPVLSEMELVESMHELLSLLIDEESLKSYGWPEASVDSVIESVISQCGHTPATETEEMSYADSLRENAKLLFSVVTDDAAIKQLLNNQTVDQVILHMLRLAKT